MYVDFIYEDMLNSFSFISLYCIDSIGSMLLYLRHTHPFHIYAISIAIERSHQYCAFFYSMDQCMFDGYEWIKRCK